MSKKSGVSSKLIKKYQFNEHIWATNKHDGQNQDCLDLAQNAVKISSQYYMRKMGSQHWITLGTIEDAIREAINTWTGATTKSGKIVDSELIQMFFKGERNTQVLLGNGKTTYVKERVGSCPNIYQKLVVPYGPQFVTYNNQHYLNVWYDDMIKPEESNLAIGKLVLLLVYGSLCAGDVDKNNLDSEADRIYNMILTNQYDNLEFKFLINWLAALYQQPGINLLTNVWLLGEVEGLGKGTINDIMSWVLGREFVGKLNQVEIEAGWNDHIVGKQLIEVNEFETGGKMGPRAWGTWIKGHTIEPGFKVRQRNTTSYQVPHIGNFMFTGNVVDQKIADQNDRRNQFIQTTSDIWWVSFATVLQTQHYKQSPETVASGFAFILDRVQVDYTFISRAFKNDIRSIIVSNNKTVVDEWFEYDSGINVEKWIRSKDMYQSFKEWYKEAYPSGHIPSVVVWGKEMVQNKRVQKKRENAGYVYLISAERPKDLVLPSIEEVSRLSNKVTGSDEVIAIPDYDTPDPVPFDPTQVSKKERMADLLRKMNEKHK